MPKRTKPVTRDEVRCGWDIETMPASSMYRNRDGDLEPIANLWMPLLRSLDQERRELWEDWVKRGVDDPDKPPEPITVPRPYRKGTCRHCGRSFYNVDKGPRQNGGVPLYCSDKCVALVHSAAMAPIVEARSKARAAERANRQCATCGKPIKAKRSTMRFCSIKCRVAAHRANPETHDNNTLKRLGLDPDALSKAEKKTGIELARRVSACDLIPGATKRRTKAIADWHAFAEKHGPKKPPPV